MTTLEDVLSGEIKKAPVKTIRLLHQFIFHEEGDRGNRGRLRAFSGWEFAADSEDARQMAEWASNTFTVPDLTCIANFLRLDYEGSKEEIAIRIMDRLRSLKFDEEEGDTEEEEEAQESEAESSSPRSSSPRSSKGAHFMLSFRDVEDTLREFTGSEDYPIETWVTEFEDTAQLFEWTDIQKFIFAKKRIKGLARLYLQGEKCLNTWSKMKKALLKEFSTKVNSAKLHSMLANRKLAKEEGLQEYLLAMKEIAARGSIEEEAVIQYIIDGITDDTHIKMSLYDATSINGLKKKLKVFEKHRDKLSATNVTKSSRSGQNTKSSTASASENTSSRVTRKCYNCDEVGHLASACTKPKRTGKYCFSCRKPGHYRKDCPDKATTRGNGSSSSVPTSADTSTNLIQEYESIVQAYTIQVRLDILDTTVLAILDTGSPISFLDVSLLSESHKLMPYNGPLSFEGVNNSRVEILGTLKQHVCLDCNNVDVVINLFVVPSSTMKFQCLLGRDFIAHDKLAISFEKGAVDIRYKFEENEINNACLELLNIDICNENDYLKPALKVNENMDIDVVNQVHQLIDENYIRQERPQKPITDFELELTLKPNSKPFYYNPRRLSYVEKEAVSKILDDLLTRNIIRPSNSQYCSPIVLVRKKDGQFRMAVDYRELNKSLERHNFPIPNIDEQIDTLRGKKYFTKLDIKDAFHHVRLKESSIPYTAFSTFKGLFEYVGMPFGLTCGPAVFMRFIHRAFDKLLRENKILIYIDDVLIATETIEENLSILREVLEIFVTNCLELKFEKCAFLCEDINYLGYQIDFQGIRPGNENIAAVKNYPVPTNFKELHSYLGFISYFRRFIKDFALIAKPLYELLKSKTEFIWSEELTDIFNRFKEILVSEPVLAIYSPNAVTELHCDASGIGFGSILLQKQSDGNFHPVCYYSKRTTPAESRYHSFELETLAIVYALERFRIYLQGQKFKIVTDCASVKAALEKKEINPRILRWSLALRNFDYELEHRAGTRLRHVDALSRNYTVAIINDNSFDRNLALLQDLDPVIKNLKEKLGEQEDKFFELNNGLVYRKVGERLLFYVPDSMESNVIWYSHDNLGHQGVNKTIEHLTRSYWFPEMKERVTKYIRNCLKCISYGSITNRVEGALHIPEKVSLPFHHIHIDHYGPLERTGNKHKYVFEIKDAFTKFVRFYATVSTNASEVVKYLRDYFRTYSKPKKITSDPGSAFKSYEFKDFLQENGIQYIQTATATPQANGQIEIVNKSLTPILAKLTMGLKNWDKVLFRVEFAINNSVNRSTGETPSRMLFGVNQVGEVDDDVRQLLLERQITDRNLEQIRENAVKKLRTVDEYNKKYYDKRHKDPTMYQEGDYVMVRNFDVTPGVNKKLLPKYRGPYVITKVLDNDRYIITDPEGQQLTQLPYRGVCSPANMRRWMQPDTDKSDKNNLMAGE